MPWKNVQGCTTFQCTKGSLPLFLVLLLIRSAAVSLKTAWGVPAAAQISSCLKRSSSMKISMGSDSPAGGTPPMAKPVCFRTNSASAFLTGSERRSRSLFSLTRFTPLATTRMGLLRRLPPEHKGLCDLLRRDSRWLGPLPVRFGSSRAARRPRRSPRDGLKRPGLSVHFH